MSRGRQLFFFFCFRFFLTVCSCQTSVSLAVRAFVYYLINRGVLLILFFFFFFLNSLFFFFFFFFLLLSKKKKKKKIVIRQVRQPLRRQKSANRSFNLGGRMTFYFLFETPLEYFFKKHNRPYPKRKPTLLRLPMFAHNFTSSDFIR